ncbi:Peptidase [Planctomycetales bacterium 10988]|nr:Peptidase [Planctomycetales bacterium 10988]
MMRLSEPPSTPYDLRFRLFGIPVRVAMWFWIMAILLGHPFESTPQEIVIWVAVVFVSILVHEFGHIAMAAYMKWEPERVILYHFGGLAISRPTYRNSYASMAVMFGGPLAGFLFAALILLVLTLFGNFPLIGLGHYKEVALPGDGQIIFNANWFFIQLSYPLQSFPLLLLIFHLLAVNILWGVLNLFPIFPLDGGQIARELLVMSDPENGPTQAYILSIVTAVAMAVLAAVSWGSFYLMIMFLILAYMSYENLRYQNYGGFGGDRW